jgi:hypothetical protein
VNNPSESTHTATQPITGRNHRTVLVRFWRVDEHEPWRATLLTPTGDGAEHFASASQLFAHLWALLDEGNQSK